jgi:hypothetical protein
MTKLLGRRCMQTEFLEERMLLYFIPITGSN